MATTLNQKLTSLAPGALLELFEVDLRPIGGVDVLRLTPNRLTLETNSALVLADRDTGRAIAYNGPLTDTLDPGPVAIALWLKPESTGSFIAIQVRNSAGVGPTFRVHTTSLQTNITSVTTVATSPRIRVTMAGDHLFVMLSFNWVAASGLRLYVEPTRGTTAFTNNNTAVGAITIPAIQYTTLSGTTAMTRDMDLSPSLWGANNTTNQRSTALSGEFTLAVVPMFGGDLYTPIPFEAEGYEYNGQGPFPRPRIRMSNLFNEGSALAQEFGDMRGAVVTRRRVYADNLDNGPYPDALAQMAPDIYVVDRKSLQTNTLIEWELASPLDQQGVMLPRRQVLRDTCPWIYRRWDGTKFVYAAEDGCPYNGTQYYDAAGNPVAQPEQDRCSHTINKGCRLRYGTKAELPFGGFPMAGRQG